MSLLGSYRFVERYNGETYWMERLMGATGKGKENAKARNKQGI